MSLRASIEKMTRRTLFVFAGAFAFAQQRRPVTRKSKPAPEKPKPGVEKTKFLDPGTEAELFRVTDPNVAASFLPPPHQAIFSRRGHFLLYAREQSGERQAWSLDLKSWRNRKLTSARSLDPESLTLTDDEKVLAYIDGNTLLAGPPGRGAKKLHEFGEKPGTGLGATAREIFAADGRRLLSIPLTGGEAQLILESKAPIEYPMAQPGGSLVAYISEGGLWVVPRTGGPAKRLPTPETGRVTQARWTANGASLLYLLSAGAGRPVSLEEIGPNGGAAVRIANTSQYASVTATNDGSVFFGASGSKAGPIIFLMLRQNRRELALCEHGAKDPALARVAVSPDSQHLFFHSDREGKSALYMLDLEKLVEKPEA